ncbi:LytTR family transcriptional regulator [Microbulbifer sp. A4B17]|uniref:LytR/AlgR family response regulator transcription factor n=1 Tax=Microbulbifer sp. A4B17 TaxID=359370 RepID=UPI000D52F163|nr:LytTR family DNA-binding domain-containing protein [Microbulbifer sp. A4B17]AWF80807.1 LytTR family transcriptional regulator [Microbulbifer sp. A4B17]
MNFYTGSGAMTVQQYLVHRRQFEVGFWVLFFFGQWLVQFALAYFDHRRWGSIFQPWEFLVWEGTSILMIAILFPLILLLDHYFSLHKGKARQNLAIHLFFTLPWSLIHVSGMVFMRAVIYHLNDDSYNFGNWLVEFFYEYLKDIQTYAALLSSVYLYRFLLVRLQGEARLLEEPDEGDAAEPVERPERLLVKKLGKEFLVNVRDIEWVEAAGNYVNLHLGDRIYPLRETMTKLLERLDPGSFARVHRSYIVRLDSIAEIEPLESGDARIHLVGGQLIPVSRRYRDQLRAQLTPA